MENPNTKYETGVWYGWNGGERPVHFKTVLNVQWPLNKEAHETIAGHVPWQDAFLFRIVTQYVPIADATEPAPKLECWNVYDADGMYQMTRLTARSAHIWAGMNCAIAGARVVRMVEADE